MRGNELAIAPKALVLLGLERQDESLEDLASGIRADLASGMRLALRIACRVALAKRCHFGGQFGPWCEWVTTTCGILKRQAITWGNAGELLISSKGLVRHGALSRCDLHRLELLASLNGEQFDACMARHPEPSELSREELREIVRKLKGQADPGSTPAPRRGGWKLPPPAELRAAPASDPWEEYEYLEAHAARMITVYNERPEALDLEHLARMREFLRQMVISLDQELQTRKDAELGHHDAPNPPPVLPAPGLPGPAELSLVGEEALLRGETIDQEAAAEVDVAAFLNGGN